MKKLVSVLVTASMVATMAAGCGASSTESASADTAGAADTVAEAAAPEAADTTEAATGATFKIGGIGPTTGAAAIYGTAAMNGAQIAVDEINANGGINGAQIEYKFEDDQHDAEKSVNAYNTLKDWGMQILYGTVTSTPCVAVATEAAADQIFTLTPSASSTDVIEAGDNIFQVCFTDPNQGTASADYISDNGLATEVAVIYNDSDVYSSGIKDTFVTEAEAVGLSVQEYAFTDDTKTDFSTQLKSASDQGAELVFFPIYYQEASMILQQANASGYSFKYFGCDGLDGILGMEGFDTSLAEGVMLLTPFAADAADDTTKAFTDKYVAAFGETPNQFAADGYDCIYVIKAAIESAGCTADMSAADICAAMTAAMPGISVDGVTGEGMTWDASGAVSKAPKAMVIENGAYKAM